MFTIGVFAIIFDDEGRVLLCHRTDYDLWNLPGGRLEAKETPEEGVRREALEETGFEIEIIKLVGVYTKLEKKELCFSFLCRIKGGSPRLNDEADRIEYFALKDFPKNVSRKQVERIKDCIENPKELLFKAQSGSSSIELIKEGKL